MLDEKTKEIVDANIRYSRADRNLSILLSQENPNEEEYKLAVYEWKIAKSKAQKMAINSENL